jgi:hypothetical protein
MSLHNLAEVLRAQGELPESARLYRRSLAMKRRLHVSGEGTARQDVLDVSVSRRDPAEVLRAPGEPSPVHPGALPIYRRLASTTDPGASAFITGRSDSESRVINLILAVDRSGSMARWKSVQQGVAEAIGQLSDVDVVTIIPFNNTVQAIGPAPKCRFPLREFAALSLPDGNTKLYDATALALVTALELHRAVDQATHLTRTTHVVVMTDGEDKDSTVKLCQLKELVLVVNRLPGDCEVCPSVSDSVAQHPVHHKHWRWRFVVSWVVLAAPSNTLMVCAFR